MSALVAGVPRPLRSTSSSTSSLPALSIADNKLSSKTIWQVWLWIFLSLFPFFHTVIYNQSFHFILKGFCAVFIEMHCHIISCIPQLPIEAVTFSCWGILCLFHNLLLHSLNLDAKKAGYLIQNKISCHLKSVVELLHYTVCKLLSFARALTTSISSPTPSAICSFVKTPCFNKRNAASFLSSVIISSIALHIACMPSLSFL